MQAATESDQSGVPAALRWELLYRLEPELYAKLIDAEPLHPGILAWLPSRVARAVEVGAGTGRLTLPLSARCDQLIAVEPATGMRRLLRHNLLADGAKSTRVMNGFFDALPVATGWAQLVVACSSFTPDPAHGGEPGLAEMERVCAPGGRVVIIWPSDPDWLSARGFEHVVFHGEMAMQLHSVEEAVELATIFYPRSAEPIRRAGSSRVPYSTLGIRPPHDLCWKAAPQR